MERFAGDVPPGMGIVALGTPEGTLKPLRREALPFGCLPKPWPRSRLPVGVLPRLRCRPSCSHKRWRQSFAAAGTHAKIASVV